MEGYEISKIKIKNSKEPSVEEKLTGSVISNLKDDEIQPNVELEGKEYLRFPDGQITRAEGETHDKSGLKMYLPDGTTILSNSMKLSSSDRKKLKKDYGLELKAGTTYAEAQEKFRQKSGIKKLDKEQEETIRALRKVMEKEADENTKRVNEEFLKNKIGEIEKEKANLQPEYDGFFQEVFGLQETKKKPKTSTPEYKYGGVTKSNLEKVLEKYGITEEELLGTNIPEYNGGGSVGKDPIHPTDVHRKHMQEMGDYLSGITGTEYDATTDQGLEAINTDMKTFLDGIGSEYEVDADGVPRVPSIYKAYTDHTKRVKSLEYKYRKLGYYDENDTGVLNSKLKEAHNRFLKENNYSITGGGTFEDVYVKPSLSIGTDKSNKTREFGGVTLMSVPKSDAGNSAQFTGERFIRKNGGTITKFENGGGVEELRKKIKEGTISGPTAQRELNTLKAEGQDVSDLEDQVAYLLEQSPKIRTTPDRVGGVETRGYQSPTKAGYGTVTEKNRDDVMYSLYRNYPDYATEQLGVTFDEDGKIKYSQLAYNQQLDEILALQEGIEQRGRINLEYMKSRPDVYSDEVIDAMEEFVQNQLFYEEKDEEGLGFDSKLGGHTGSRYNVALSLVTPEELEKYEKDNIFTTKQLQKRIEEDPKYASDETKARLKEYLDGAPEGVDFRLDAFKTVPAQEAEEVEIKSPAEGVEGGDPIEDDIVTMTRKRFPKAFAHMDMRPLPPSPMDAHLKGETRLERIDPVRVGTQNVEQQIANQMGAVMTQVESLPPAQRAAALASLQTGANQSLNQAITQANQINAQNISSAELFNIGQSAQEQQANLANALSYEKRQFLAKSNTEEDVRRYYDRLQSIALNEMQNNQKLNMLDQMSDNYSLNLDGAGISYDPKTKYVKSDINAIMKYFQ